MNMNSAEFWRSHLSLLKLVLCQHKNLPPSFLLAAQTAALGNYYQGTGLWSSLRSTPGGGRGMSHSGLEEAHGNLAGLGSTALPSHLHRNPRGCHPDPLWWERKEQSVPSPLCRSTTGCPHGSLMHKAHCAPCANSSLLANLIKRWESKEKSPKDCKHQFPLRAVEFPRGTRLWLLGFPAMGQGQTSSRRKGLKGNIDPI